MKKFLLILTAICFFSSCATIPTTVTTNIGDVTAYNADGSVLKQWKGVELSSSLSNVYSVQRTSAMKTFGINFYDENNGKYVIVGNAVPCIIEYEVHSEVLGKHSSAQEEHDKVELRNEYHSLTQQIISAKKELKGIDKNTSEYKTKKEEIKSATERQRYINNLYHKRYGQYLN